MTELENTSSLNLTKYSCNASELSDQNTLGQQQTQKGGYPVTAESCTDWVTVVDSIAWPLTLLIVFLFVTLNKTIRYTVKQYFGKLTKVKGGPVELEFDTELARSVSADFKASYRPFKDLADSEYKRLSKHFEIRNRLHDVSEACKQYFESYETQIPIPGFRLAVHVKDILFEDHLYQLTDYYPKGSGRGNRYSVRFGIIGQSWRCHSDKLMDDVIDEIKPAHVGPVEGKETLIRYWGMMRHEADALKMPQSTMACLIIRGETGKVGLLYISFDEPHVFQSRKLGKEEFLDSLKRNDSFLRLSEAVAKLMGFMLEGATTLEL